MHRAIVCLSPGKHRDRVAAALAEPADRVSVLLAPGVDPARARHLMIELIDLPAGVDAASLAATVGRLQGLSRDVLLRPLGNTVYVMPPYCTDEHDLALVEGAIASGLDVIAS